MFGQPAQTRPGSYGGTDRRTHAPGSATTMGRTQKAPRGGRFHFLSMANLICVPWGIFFLVTGAFFLYFYSSPLLVWLIVLACGAVAGVIAVVYVTSSNSAPYYLYLAVLAGVATVVGVFVGIWIFGEWMAAYWQKDVREVHYNVLPTEPAMAHVGAAELGFSTGAKIDFAKVVGYAAGDIYCAAPIMDDTQAVKANFWAVGINCCDQRSNFACDDSLDSHAKAGVVVFKGSSLVPSDYKYYLAAVKEAAAAYSLVLPPEPVEPMMVHWVKDPLAVSTRLYYKGLGSLGVAWLVYGVISIILGVALHMSNARQTKNRPTATATARTMP